MSEENDQPEATEPEESEPERKFSQEHYERLMKGQGPWLEFRTDWKGEGDPWEAFEKDSPEDAAAIREAVEVWNMDAPTPALLDGADLSWAHLDGADLSWAHLEGADLSWAHLEGANLRFAHLEEAEFVTAHLERASLVGAHLEGANLIGAHLEGAGLYEAHLEGARLVQAHLEEALLPEAHLEEALLAEAHLEGARLVKVHLEGASLVGAHLEGADLNKAILRGADMSRCDLKAANLANADLTDVIGLTAGQLAGADVTSARLPEDIAEFESLKVADEAAKNSRSLFLIMLLGCVYSWLVLGTTTDAALIMNTGSSPLPIIRVPVPIVGFFLVAPAFLLGAYVYFHLYLHGLWVSLSKLPAIFPDGRPLDERAYPWLLTSLVRPHFKGLRDERPLFSKAKVGLSVLLAWWVVPFTIYLFWAQALAAHVWYMTAIHLVLFLASVAGGLVLYRGAVSTLRLEDPQPVSPSSFVWQAITTKRGAITVGAVVQASLTVLAFWGPSRLPEATPLFHPYANLALEQLSTRTDPRFPGDSVRVRPARLPGRNFRFANLAGAFLSGADLTEADLHAAVLVSADLTGADLTRANLTTANLAAANLTAANLTAARLRFADLTGADLGFAMLRDADLALTSLLNARFNSVFGWTDIQWLSGANLFGAGSLPTVPTVYDLTAFITGPPDGFWTFAADNGAVCMNPAVADSVRRELRLAPPPFTAPEGDGPPPECAR